MSLPFRRRWLVLALLASLAIATPTPAPAAPPSELDLVPADSTLIVSLRMAEMWKSKPARLLRQQPALQKIVQSGLGILFLAPGDIERATVFQTHDNVSCLVHLNRPANQAHLARALIPHARTRTVACLPCLVNEEDWTGLVFLDESTFLIGRVNELEAILSAKKDVAGPLSAALDMARCGRHVVVAVNPQQLPPGVRAARFDPEMASLRPFFPAQSLILGLDFTANSMSAEVALAYATEKQARSGEEAVQELSQMLQRMVAEVPILPKELGNESEQVIAQAFDRFGKACGVGLRHLKLEREGGNVRANMVAQATDNVAVMGLLASQLDLECKFLNPNEETSDYHDRMARLGVALLEYHRKNGRLPGRAFYSAEGKPLLSWRVALLPYLGHGDLYKQFHLDEPWDSQHNLALLARMPAVYASGVSDGAPTSSFQAITGKGTAFEGKKGRRLHDLKDGPEQTILVAEAERRVPWTKPEDLVFGSDKPLPRLAAGNPAIILADGQMVLLPEPGAVGPAVPRGITESHVRALMTRSSADRAEAAAILALCLRPHQVTGVEQAGWAGPQPIPREVLPMPTPHYLPPALLPVDRKLPEPLPLPPFTVDQGSAVRQQPGEDQPR